MTVRNGAGECQPEQCVETARKLVKAVYDNDGGQLLNQLSEGSKSTLRDNKMPVDKAGLASLAGAIRETWSCPPDRVLVLQADFDHPHLGGRVRVPIILDPRGSIPEGHILSEGDPLPSSCGSVSLLLAKEGGEWKIDNIAELTAVL